MDDAALAGLVFRLMANLRSPLNEVTELAFTHMVDGTSMKNIHGDICGSVTDRNAFLARWISPGSQSLGDLLNFGVILAISSPDNNDYFLKLLKHFHPEANSPIGRLLGELTYGQLPGPSDEISIENQIPPLRLSRPSSVDEPPVLRLDMGDTGRGSSPITPSHGPNDLTRNYSHGTDISLISFGTEETFENPSWVAPDRMETQLQPKEVFGPLSTPNFFLRPAEDDPMCDLTPLSNYVPSVQPSRADTTPRTKIWRPATPHPGDRIRASLSPSPLSRKGRDGVGKSWSERTRAGKRMQLLPSASSLLSQPPRRPGGQAKTRSSMLKRAPRRKAKRVPEVSHSGPAHQSPSCHNPSYEWPSPHISSHQNSSDESATNKTKIECSYKEFAPHIPLEIGPFWEGKFNMSRVSHGSRHAILTPSVIQEVLQEAQIITNNVWFSPIFDDMSLRLQLGGGNSDFLDLSCKGSRVLDVESELSSKIKTATDSAVLLKFFRYCVLLVEDATAGDSPEQGSQQCDLRVNIMR